MKTRLSLSIIAAVLCAACAGALQGGTIGTSTPGTTAGKYHRVGLTVRDDKGPVAGAMCGLDGATDQAVGPSDPNGTIFFPLVPLSLRATQLVCTAPGYQPFSQHRDLTGAEPEPTLVAWMTPVPPPLPPAPTRDEILDLHLTFQGLMVTCGAPYGTLPWFEPALAWLPADCRQAAYAAKHASQAWGPGGDTHAIVFLPSGPPLYDEDGQPYSAAHFPALDWTAGGTHIDGRLADLIVEVAQAGFNRQLLIEGGDDGNNGGFDIAMAQLDLLHQALRVESKYGDLGPYVVLMPGMDGVFYGYSPAQVAAWGAKCRALFIYCGIEHQPGRIPVGEGGDDYLPGGRMTTFDLILAEFDGPNLSDWRTRLLGRNAQGHPDYNGNQIWQIGARMLGVDYRHPSDQPADADGYTGEGYLSPESERGPYRHCAFEWVGEYNFVRGWETPADEQRSRDYFKSAGWTCGG